jgi:hypothetical protein
MNNNVRTVIQDKANPGVEPVTKWVATTEEISQHLPTLTKGQQVCVLAHARYQKIPDVAKESGYSVHSIRQWLKTEATFYACWHGMGRHVLEYGREMALNLARADAPRAVLALQEIGSIPTYDSETGMLRPQALGSVVRANETMLKVAGVLKDDRQSDNVVTLINQAVINVNKGGRPKEPWEH